MEEAFRKLMLDCINADPEDRLKSMAAVLDSIQDMEPPTVLDVALDNNELLVEQKVNTGIIARNTMQ